MSRAKAPAKQLALRDFLPQCRHWQQLIAADLRQQGSTSATLSGHSERLLVACLALLLATEGQQLPASSGQFASACRHHFGPDDTWDTGPLPTAGTIKAVMSELLTARQSCGGLPLPLLGTVQEYLRAQPDGLSGRTTRKQAGAYYTPPLLVEYLVQQTLGPLLAERTPATMVDFTVLDPACGAGAFLLSAYEFLLTWYQQQYGNNHTQYADQLHQDHQGNWHLTAAARTQILTNHLYGVDCDRNALFAARLTLLLASGNASTPSPRLSLQLHHGDSLLDPAALTSESLAALPPAVQSGLLPFDWAGTFPTIMARGGFTAIIGNPPYLSYSGRQAVPLAAPLRHYLRQHYPQAGWPAAHSYFIARAVGLAQRRVAFVVPAQVGYLASYAPARTALRGLVDVRYWGEKLFPGATTPILTFVADTAHRGTTTLTLIAGEVQKYTNRPGAPWHAPANTALLAKLRANSTSLGPLLADIGVHTGNCASNVLFPVATAPPTAVPVLEGQAVERYRCAPPRHALLPDYQSIGDEYWTVRAESRYQAAQFVVRQTASYPIVGPRRHAVYFRNSLFALYPPDDGRSSEYLVGLLNSRLLRFYYRATVAESQQRTFPQVKISALRQLPIRHLDLTTTPDRQYHEQITATVRQLLILHAAQDSTAPTSPAAATLAAQIAATDQALDQLIYRLYHLTAAEIVTVEAATA